MDSFDEQRLILIKACPDISCQDDLAVECNVTIVIARTNHHRSPFRESE